MALRVRVLICVTCCWVWASAAALQKLGSGIAGAVSWRSHANSLAEPLEGRKMGSLASLSVASLNVRYAATVAPCTQPGHECPWAERRDALGTAVLSRTLS